MMEENQRQSTEKVEVSAFDVEFLPIMLYHKIHRNLKSSQVEIVALPYYVRETTPEPEPETEGEAEEEVRIQPPGVVFAPPLADFKQGKNWWDFVKPVYSFNNPRIRSRLELLMNSSIVYVTDRNYMVKLQERIKENHLECLKNRIRQREADEIEREKVLLLSGKISFEEAPIELRKHPVCRINQTAKRILARKRAKTKTMDRTSAYKTSLKKVKVAERVMRGFFENEAEKAVSSQMSQTVCIVDGKVSEDIEKGLMFTQEDYEKLRFDDNFIKLLREIDTINDMYELADRMIGVLTVTYPK